MINQLLNRISEFIYGTARVRRKFEQENPNEKVWVANASKSIQTAQDQEIQRGLDWVLAQRAVILLTDKRIVCGKWNIPLDTITSARLLKFDSLSGGTQALKIQTSDQKNYFFGMQSNTEWTLQQRLPLIPEKAQLKFSKFSIIIKFIAMAYLVYWFYT